MKLSIGPRPTPPPRPLRRLWKRRGAAALTAVAVSAGAFIGLATPASAADPHRVGPGVEITGVTQVGTTFLGAVGAPNGLDTLAWCLQAGLWSPVGTDILAESLIDDAQLAWIIWKYEAVETGLSRGAIGYLVHVRHDEGSNGVSAADRRAAIEANTPQNVKDLAGQYLAEAAQQAGPYPDVVASNEYTQAMQHGVIGPFGVKNDAGNWIAGIPLQVDVDSFVTLDATGTQTWSGLSGAQPIYLNYSAIGTGKVHGSLTTFAKPRTTLTKLGTNGDVQDVLSYGRRPEITDPSTTVVPITPFDVVLDFRFRGTTTVQSDVVKKGDPLVDGLTGFAAEGDTWTPGENGDEFVDMVTKVTWYGPYATPQPQQTTAPAGAPVVGVETVTFPGPGQVMSPGGVTAPADGFYTAVLSAAKADQGVNAIHLREDWTAPFFEEVETSVVKAIVKHRSMAREYNVAPGGDAFDTITIDGLPADHGTFEGLGKWAPDTKAATVRVYGPLEQAPSTVEIPGGAPVYYETTVDAVNGTFDIGYDEEIVLPATVTYSTGDHYVFVYTLAGDSRVEDYTSPFNDIRERFYVPGTVVPAEAPTVVTQAQPTAKVGEEFDDVALVTGTTEAGDYLVFEAYGPRDPAAASTCDVSPVWTSKQIPVTGQGYYSSGTTTITTPGAVDWVESLYGADGTVKHRGECGAPGETTLVTEGPWVTTKATSDHGDKPVVGDKIWDTIEIGGTFPIGSKIIVDLFYAAAGVELTCTSPIWTSDPIAIVDGITSYNSATYDTSKPGTYGFVERTEGPDGAVMVKGKCGESTETLTVTSPTPTAKPSVLAHTGVQVAGLVALALGLAGLGAMLMIPRRRKVNAA